jgi:hypothetical protein
MDASCGLSLVCLHSLLPPHPKDICSVFASPLFSSCYFTMSLGSIVAEQKFLRPWIVYFSSTETTIQCIWAVINVVIHWASASIKRELKNCILFWNNREFISSFIALLFVTHYILTLEMFWFLLSKIVLVSCNLTCILNLKSMWSKI